MVRLMRGPRAETDVEQTARKLASLDRRAKADEAAELDDAEWPPADPVDIPAAVHSPPVKSVVVPAGLAAV